MIVVLDHDDSFVFTLARYAAELGVPAKVVAARSTTAAAVADLGPSHLILSPGPRTPANCPVAIALIHQLGDTVPILGVCLGHQCIAAAFGATVARSRHPLHGSASLVTHDGAGVLRGIQSPFRAARYHSLSVVEESVPDTLVVTAHSDDGEVMGVRHRTLPIEGVQYHPESVLSEWGYRLIANFLGVPDAAAGSGADMIAGR